jgi:hypothetical protein
MDPSEANLVLKIEPTLLLLSRSFAIVFPRVTEAWGLAWASLTGVAGLGEVRPALPPGPGPLLLWCSCLIQHDRDEFSCLGAGAWILTRCEPA